LALFSRHPILSFGQDLIQKHHGVLLHAFNYVGVDTHRKVNSGVPRNPNRRRQVSEYQEESIPFGLASGVAMTAACTIVEPQAIPERRRSGNWYNRTSMYAVADE